MNKTISIIGGDLRIVKLTELLIKDDFKVYTYGVENADELKESKNIIKCNSIK